MRRRTRTVTLLSVGGALVALTALVVGLYVLDGGRGFSSCSGTIGCGWVVPIAAGAVIGAVLWVLSAQTPKGDDDARGLLRARCSQCGATLFEDWRLCPFCGQRNEVPDDG